MRRFIAGAKCPGCGQIDKLFVDETATGKRRQCVACGFQDALENVPAALPVTRHQPASGAAEAVPVRVLDPAVVTVKP